MKINSRFILIFSLLLIFSAVTFAGCIGSEEKTIPSQTAEEKTTLTVFTAASLTGAFSEICSEYNAENQNIKVEPVFDGSQALRTQIEQGAFADIFVSANTKHMNALKDEGYMDNDTIVLFLENSLAVIIPKENKAGINSLSDLAKPGIKIVIGTADVPFGSYTRQILDKMANSSEYGEDYKEAVYANVISEETSVGTVVPKLTLGEADAAFVYKSDILREYRDQLSRIDIPAEYNVIAKYPLGIVAESDNKQAAADFIEFVRGDSGSAILKDYGFDPV